MQDHAKPKMQPPIAYQNGSFLETNRVSIPLQDAGFLWGATVADRIRTFRGKLFRLEDHIARFRENCERAYIHFPESDETLFEISHRLVNENYDSHELSLTWLATPGISTGFASSDDMRIPTRIAYTQPILPISYKKLLTDGATLITTPASLGVDPSIKHRSRLAWWIAQQGIRETDPRAEPLFVDLGSDTVLETPTANLLLVLDGTLTSPAKGTVLEGISLKVVEELCAAMSIPFEQRRVLRGELKSASEAILTNTTYCLAGVARIDEHIFPHSRPMLSSLQSAWRALVESDLMCEKSVQR